VQTCGQPLHVGPGHMLDCRRIGHREWLNTPGRGGRVRNDSEQRILTVDDVGGYEDEWDRLTVSTRDVPFLSPG
jgi:hypothetical protein